MYRHISVFTLKNKNEIDQMVAMLEEVGKCSLIAHSQVGRNFSVVPEGAPGPHFGDVVQIIDFNTKEDLDHYPSSEEHMKLFREGPVMETVTAIDYEYE